MGNEVTCQWAKAPFTDAEDGLLVPGRFRLLGFSWADGAANPYLVARQGDESGAIALQVTSLGVTWPDYFHYKRIPAGGVLFPSGGHFKFGNVNSSSSYRVKAITLVYQRG